VSALLGRTRAGSVVSSGRGRVEVSLVRASAPIAGTTFDGIHGPVGALIGPSLPRSKARPGYQHSWTLDISSALPPHSLELRPQWARDSLPAASYTTDDPRRMVAGQQLTATVAATPNLTVNVPASLRPSSTAATAPGHMAAPKAKKPPWLQLPEPSRCRLAASPACGACSSCPSSLAPTLDLTSSVLCYRQSPFHASLPRPVPHECLARHVAGAASPANGIMYAALGLYALCPPVPSSWRGFPRGAQVALHKGPANLSLVPSRGGKTWSFNKHDGMRMPCNHTQN
jgi:hypothetical protein